MFKKCIFTLLLIFIFTSCDNSQRDNIPKAKKVHQKIIVDCNYTFNEAIASSKAPNSIIKQLELIKVLYYSKDGKIHSGQLLINKTIAKDAKSIFNFMLKVHFPIVKVIPIVKYNWNDNLSMLDNNSYSFCYRNIGYSKHAYGMAIDINPFFNPVRWKDGYKHRENVPKGASYNTSVNGTFYSNHRVVKEFKKLGFRWGHTFTRNYDDHHFEK